VDRNVAFLFPGQGRSLEDLPPPSADIDRLYARACERGLSLKQWILNGETNRLSRTDAMQPALLIDGLGRTAALRSVGHSLGEYTALTCADVVSARDALEIVIERGRLMQGIAGKMTAILKLDLETVRVLCEDTDSDVTIANHNGPLQVVVSGKEEPVRRLVTAAERAGGRAIPLRVSGPFHSPYMSPAQDALAPIIARTRFSPPSTPVVSGVSGEIEREAERLKMLMLRQMTACVRWVDVIRRMEEANVTHAVEVGSGETLTGMGKRITTKIEFVPYEEALHGGV
jgi:[acyl-carrier-protein] S-malonyltransferase